MGKVSIAVGCPLELCLQTTTPNIGAMFRHAFQNIVKTISTKKLNHQWTINIFMHFRTIPRPHEVSPPISSSEATAVFVLCIHGRLRLEEPLDHGIVAVPGCRAQRCYASGAAARGQATGRTQTERRGEKFWENFGHLKSRSFGKCGHSSSFLELRNIVLLRMFWWHRAGWKRPCEPGWQSKCFAET